MKIKIQSFLFFLMSLVSVGQSDSVKIKTLLKEAYDYEESNPTKAIQIYSNAYKLSNKIDYQLGAFRAMQNSGIVHANSANYDSALFYYKKAIPHSDLAKYKKGKASTYINIGNVYQFNGQLDKVVEYYSKGIIIFESIKDSVSIGQTYTNLAALFSSINQFDKEFEYLSKALIIIPKKQLAKRGYIYTDLGLSHLHRNQIKKAIPYFIKADSISKITNDIRLDFFATRNFGEYYIYNKEYKKALPYLEKSILINNKINNTYYSHDLSIMLGEVHNHLHNYSKATLYLTKALKMGIEKEALDIQEKAYLNLSQVYNNEKKYKKAYENLSFHMIIKDSLKNEKTLNQINLLEKQYETEKKDNEIAFQKLQLTEQENFILKNKNKFNLALGGGVLFFLIGLGLWFYYNQQQKIKNNRIVTLQSRQKLIKLESLIDGEEKERHRLAQDLHDGINGDLAVIKYKITSLDYAKFNKKEKDIYNDAISMLDNAVDQVRKISHNLTPPSLHNFDVTEAIQQLCTKLNSSQPGSINFLFFGDRLLLKKEIETAIYRIIQELLNNAIKHANATEILVQINHHKNKLNITVEDNGSGFDPTANSNGIGLRNITSRVTFLKANLDIASNKKGSSFIIEIDLNNNTQA